jgi:hypothetical protein
MLQVWPAGPPGSTRQGCGEANCRPRASPVLLDVPALRPQPSSGSVRPPAEESASTQVQWSPSPPAQGGVDGSREADGDQEMVEEGLVRRSSPGGSLEPLPLGQGGGESEQSAEPALGTESVVREPASEQGPPFRVLSG